MPQAEPASRSAHRRFRNGCLRCKQRRVKCNSQAPSCSNCQRRNEVCQYPSWDPVPPQGNRGILPRSSAVCTYRGTPQIMTPHAAPSFVKEIDLQKVLWICSISEGEVGLWRRILGNPVISTPYLQHGWVALLSLYDATSSNSRPPSLAYTHHIEASKLFRVSPPTVNERNWGQILTFSVIVLIFYFAVQQLRETGDFDYMETLRVLRVSNSLSTTVAPFLFRNEVWRHLLKRNLLPPGHAESELETPFEELEAAVFASSNGANEESRTSRIQALGVLKAWATECSGYPRTWRHYTQWIGTVPAHYLTLLEEEDDVALLILIHWCAILHMGPKRWFMENWTRRTVESAISKLTGSWDAVLFWPTSVLGLQPTKHITMM